MRNLKERDFHQRAKRLGISLRAKISFLDVPLVNSADDPTIVTEKWPMILPYDLEPQSTWQSLTVHA